MKDYSILVNTCDAYMDLWDSFLLLLKKNWPNIEQKKIYFNTESISHYNGSLPIILINTNLSGRDKWGKRLLNCLSQIDTQYIIVLMDDFFLKKPIKQSSILECLSLFENDDRVAAFYLKNVFNSLSNVSIQNEYFIIPKDTPYRLNSAPALWRKDKLISYVNENDNPWAWEFFGTCRTNRTDDIFLCSSMDAPIYDYAHAIYRGKWIEEEVRPLLETYYLSIDMSKRGSISINNEPPKRSMKWKIMFLLSGIKMVGFDAIKELLKIRKNSNKTIVKD